MILDRGKIFDTSEIKHSQEHVLYTVIKVLRSSMLVQGVLLARRTADTVGQRAQLSPWVTLNRNVSADAPVLPPGQRSGLQKRKKKPKKKKKNDKTRRLFWNPARLTFSNSAHKVLHFVTICKCHLAVGSWRLTCVVVGCVFGTLYSQ